MSGLPVTMRLCPANDLYLTVSLFDVVVWHCAEGGLFYMPVLHESSSGHVFLVVQRTHLHPDTVVTC
jgi:hypothetical protein